MARERIARGALRSPEPVPVVCPVCRERIGSGVASVTADGIGVEIDAATYAAHQSHMHTEHPNEGAI